MFEGSLGEKYTVGLSDVFDEHLRSEQKEKRRVLTQAGNYLIDERSHEKNPRVHIMPEQYEGIFAQIVSVFAQAKERVDDWVVGCSVAKVGKGKHQTQSNDLDMFTTLDGVAELYAFFQKPEGKEVLATYGLQVGFEHVDTFGRSTRLTIVGAYKGKTIDIEIFGEGSKSGVEDQGGTVQLGGFREVEIHRHTMQYTDSEGVTQETIYQDVSDRELRRQYIRVALRELIQTETAMQRWITTPDQEDILEDLAKKIPSRFQSVLQLSSPAQKNDLSSIKREWVSALRDLATSDTKEDSRQYALPRELVVPARDIINTLFQETEERPQTIGEHNEQLHQYLQEIQLIPLEAGTIKTIYEAYFSQLKKLWEKKTIDGMQQKSIELHTIISSLPPMYGLFFRFLLELHEQVFNYTKSLKK